MCLESPAGEDNHSQEDQKIKDKTDEKVEVEDELRTAHAEQDQDTVEVEAYVSNETFEEIQTIEIPKKSILGKRSREQTFDRSEEIEPKIEKKYGCKHCQKTFKSPQALGGHTGKAHTDQNENY